MRSNRALGSAPDKTLQIVVETNGDLRFLHDDDLAPLFDEGTVSIERASHVEPDARGLWFADLSPVGGPRLSGFALRGEALQAEARWLHENRL